MEGTHFLVPWLQKAILYDVRIKPRVRILVAGAYADHLDYDGI